MFDQQDHSFRRGAMTDGYAAADTTGAGDTRAWLEEKLDELTCRLFDAADVADKAAVKFLRRHLDPESSGEGMSMDHAVDACNELERAVCAIEQAVRKYQASF